MHKAVESSLAEENRVDIHGTDAMIAVHGLLLTLLRYFGTIS